MRKLAQVLLPIAGLAAFTLPAVATLPVATLPAGAQCVGGLCDVCPAVAKVVAATGEQIYCIA